MGLFFIRTNLREFTVEAAGIGAALEIGMQLCIHNIEWITLAEAVPAMQEAA